MSEHLQTQMRHQHQRNMAAALKFFIDETPSAVNGIIIWVEGDDIQGKLVFEIEGKLPLEEAYREKMQGDSNEYTARF